MRIKFNGFYISEPLHWTDFHAGVKFEGDNYYVVKFDAQKCYFDTIRDKNEINFQNLLTRENFGFYRVTEKTIEIRYNPTTEFELTRVFTILSPEVLLDEELREFKFVERETPA